MKTLKYFFDFLSPYSYFSWFGLKHLSRDFPTLNIEIYPVVLARMLSHWGIKGPGEVAPKRNYLFRHCLRYAEMHGLPFKAPQSLPFNSLYALRLATRINSGEKQKEVIEALWKWGWQKGGDMGNPEALVMALEEAHLDGKNLLERTFLPEVRQELKNNIQLGLEGGVFGVPSFLWGDELFWGNDSLDSLKKVLQGEDCLNAETSSLHYVEFLQKFIPHRDPPK